MTRQALIVLATAAITFLLIASPVQGQVTASLAVIPEQTLPGIPVDFRITLNNGSSQIATLRNAAALEITTEAGARFLASSEDAEIFAAVDRRLDDRRPAAETLAIQPGTSRDFYHTSDCALVTQEYFYDRRLSMPGRYTLRIVMLPPSATSVDDTSALWSNPVILTIQQPQGEDAAVWQMLTALSAARGGGFSASDWAGQSRVAEEIYANYPHSHYLPYVACLRAGTPEQMLQNLDAALALSPAGPIADRLKLTVAAVHDRLADAKRSALDAEGAIADLTAARQIAQDVQARSIYPFVRDEARQFTNQIKWSDDGLLRNVADLTQARRASPYLQVIPFVDCVSIQHDGGLTARFGYKNIKDQTETIEAGSNNAISPADASKKLPTTFRAGAHKNALRATSAGGPITWKLLSFSVTASKTSPPCGGNN